MPRLLLPMLVAVLVGALATACGGQKVQVVSPSPPRTVSTPPSSIPTGSVSPSPTPSLIASPQIPPDAPTTYAGSLAASDLPVDRLVPSGARVTSTWSMSPPDDPIEQVGFAWARGAEIGGEHGFEIWRPTEDGSAWRVVYAFWDRSDVGVLGIRLVTDDLTGDGVPDALTFEDLGGSGACGIWRVVASGSGSATEIYRKQTCDTDVRIANGDLVVRESVYQPGDAHCCPSEFRTTTLEWDGSSWRVIDKVVEPA